jgi:hypothetical protein
MRNEDAPSNSTKHGSNLALSEGMDSSSDRSGSGYIQNTSSRNGKRWKHDVPGNRYHDYIRKHGKRLQKKIKELYWNNPYRSSTKEDTNEVI